ncbi:flagellar FliJ protein [Alkalithermobacter thermoalcaliphilus JW-YL-7 = DSM 7308]|uniref:Flagellar FliJ protein n=1 Tax=Alkalithermobacter thermoalcaliphilus JW-YL-7 = DSM 7308 TaxID=1121328 RepID=A0A150FQB5_CLOPD|nr:flagellar export protein FliJ [[Clostridium] paradoxum JW-YL-7 = DSM 7308]SHK61379.1 flagellar FliJ protein [[Clostridium] paradoxum JW-YL-7 = DSM 7308]
MKYKFKLQKVLDIKEKMEESKKAEINSINIDIQNLNRELENLIRVREYKKYELTQTMQEGIPISLLRFEENLVTSIDIKICKVKEAIFLLEERLKEKMKEYSQLAKEKKALEKLKERDLQKFKEYEKKEEDKFIDQIVTFKTIASN